MADAKIDPNYVKTLLLYNPTTGLTEPARVDPVTGAVLIYGVSATTGTPGDINILKRDENHKTVMGLYNDTTGEVECARCTDDNTLLVKIV